MISVIVPSYNSEKTIARSLGAVMKSDYPEFELIVVNDGSTDSSLAIIRQYPCKVVELEKNKGHSHARNTGVKHAAHEILVFIDADVVINENTLSLIHQFFDRNKSVAGVVGLLDEHCPYTNFFSQYKNLYMNFIFMKTSPEINFFYGSLHAIRRTDYLPYDESLSFAEDTELGQRFTDSGKKITLLKTLLVTHLKRHDLISIIKNDFRIPFYWATLFFRYMNLPKMADKKKFAHASAKQIASVLTAPALSLLLLLSLCVSSVFLGFFCAFFSVFIILNANFLSFLYKKRGFLFFLKALIFTFADQTVMFTGIVCGTIHHFTRKL